MDSLSHPPKRGSSPPPDPDAPALSDSPPAPEKRPRLTEAEQPVAEEPRHERPARPAEELQEELVDVLVEMGNEEPEEEQEMDENFEFSMMVLNALRRMPRERAERVKLEILRLLASVRRDQERCEGA
ncbi:proline-rich protein 12-like [Amphibalanus amphitrite]|uniref:proline-rich protein 12-like n=1 Tax=Amphibalanus amphitrite TaxID=1232801 RepID=UPI001C92479D|nr:proline-rich protein 12-like [Amphibalanus amphitrite]XP_043232125.1 proline-rich protein 12-like [Amphibalanus amphitrite]